MQAQGTGDYMLMRSGTSGEQAKGLKDGNGL
jgi:hypothetical protein